MPAERARKADQSKALRKLAGKWLKEKRLAASLTQKDLASRVGLEYYTFVSQIEGGHGRVPSSLYPDWAEALGIDVAEFARKMLEFYDPHAFRAMGFVPTETDEDSQVPASANDMIA